MLKEQQKTLGLSFEARVANTLIYESEIQFLKLGVLTLCNVNLKSAALLYQKCTLSPSARLYPIQQGRSYCKHYKILNSRNIFPIQKCASHST